MDFYLATTAHIHAMQRPDDTTCDHLQPTQWPGLAFDHPEPALQWLFTEAETLFACVGASAHGPALRRAVDLMFVAEDLVETGSAVQQYAQVNARLLVAAERAGDARSTGRLYCPMVHLHVMAGRLPEAEHAAQAARRFPLRCSDPVLTAQALNESGILASMQHRYTEAAHYLLQALDAYRRYGNRNGCANMLGNLSRLCLDTDRVTEAVSLAEQCLAALRSIGATLRLANGHYSLGLALAQAGRTDDALEQLARAWPIYQSHRHRLWEALTYWRMADVHLTAGRRALPRPAVSSPWSPPWASIRRSRCRRSSASASDSPSAASEGGSPRPRPLPDPS
ncbi:tetratricopeptide repeat protein [Streptomyces sp. NPDC045456]|uniref:tetratricopeptide repeat protein n=1 Tax=Streptomyces sp. NPDC045456 TaxID=3155254 RepID=UPI00341002A5